MSEHSKTPVQIATDLAATSSVPGCQQSRLLKLPAELRTSIYEYALTEGVIPITPTFTQPALLSTCHRIRKEALGLYYAANTFHITVQDCDAALYVAFRQHLNYVGATPAPLHLVADGKDWHGLMKWCKAVWRYDVGIMNMVEVSNVDFLSEAEVVVSAAHDIVQQHLDLDRPWEECMGALETLRVVIGRYDRAWRRE